MSDFNGHSSLWGSKTTNEKGKKYEDFLARRDCVSLTAVLIHICLLGMGLI
jgi:hypothetical protein